MAFKRGKGRNNVDYATKHLYKEYLTSAKNPVPYKVYSEFLKEYNERMINAIIYQAMEYKLPYSLGYLRIQRRKLEPYVKDGEIVKKHILPDWKATLDYWRALYPDKTDEEIKMIPDKKVLIHTNKHTDGYSVRFFWDKRFSTVKNQSAYIYKATRTTKEDLAKFIKNNKVIEYFD